MQRTPTTPTTPTPESPERRHRFWATFEIIRRGSAIVELTNADTGEWAGGGLVEVRHHDALYDECFRVASQSAASKGGDLDRFSACDGNCPQRAEVSA